MNCKNLYRLVVIGFMFLSNNAIAQTQIYGFDSSVEMGEKTDLRNLEDVVEVFKNEKLLINEIDADELGVVFWLSEEQIENLIRYRERYGPIRSKSELYFVKGMRMDEIRALAEIFSFESSSENPQCGPKNWSILDVKYHFKERIFYDNTEDLGSAWGLMTRYQARKGKFRYGVLLENDPGELKSFKINTGKSFIDHISYYVKTEYFESLGVENLVVGNFKLHFGQGLLLGNAYGVSKSWDPIRIYQHHINSLHAVASSSEYLQQRGFAMELKALPKLKTIVAFSYNREDASLNDDDLATSLNFSGSHNTLASLKKKDNLGIQLLAINNTYELDEKTKLGLTVAYMSYSNTVALRKKDYSFYAYEGKSSLNSSAYFTRHFDKGILFGEAVWEKSKLKAYTTGSVLKISPFVHASINYRNFSPDNFSPYGTALRLGSSISNERAIYVGLKVFPSQNFKLDGYLESAWFEDMKMSVRLFDTRRVVAQLRATRSFSRKSFISLTLKNDSYPFTLKDEGKYKSAEMSKYSGRLSYRTFLQKNIRVSGDLISKFLKKGELDSQGWLIKQEIKYAINDFILHAGVVFYQLDEFDNRVYLYEQNVPNHFKNTMFNGTGEKLFLLFKLRINDKLSLWAKCSRERKYDLSENEEEKLNFSEFITQLRVKL
ncbi:hypothetical protein [Aureibacter tunicatorum]|uniref:Helix-hairpin-helix motif-containing protein n=1 Tax=Aureibacter tunicatorum TaxID=866807 RepID=A0AAE4BSG1_9BACT|nr:hypothetical protein [Aureibacter tunicatorum]MDR6241209.1 hypothetical protein [Aureibacter tunicatorum]BDD03470.1 hypothetical protein AUTU_09530 [Aureibacter tunicatorum]